MRGQSFDAKGFGRVVTAEEKVDSELFRRHRRPMGCFAGDEHVDLLLRDPVNFRPSAASDDTDPGGFSWPKIERLDWAAQYSSEFANDFGPR